MIQYERLDAEEALSALSSDSSVGLTENQVEKRIVEHGANVLAQKKGRSPIIKLLLQFNDPLIYILLVAATISIALGELADSIIILIVVVVNGTIGYIQEAKAEKAIDALKKLTSPKAIVKRDGAIKELDAAELVPGDIVLLDAGRLIPADLRLVESSNLKIEESALTGESVPSEKDFTYKAENETPLGDRINMAYMSTVVTYGRGAGVVVSTGMSTEIGKIAKILEDTVEEMTPLQKRLADLGKMLGILTIVICALLFLVALLQKRDLIEMLLTAISLSVAAIPEGLPAVVTIVLAAGVSRMAKSRSIVRKLPAVETLGAVSVVCSDKTGTLTQNRMTVTESRIGAELKNPEDSSHEVKVKFFEGFTLCNDASIESEEKIGDPTETALLDFTAKYGYNRSQLEASFPRVDEIPFDSVRKMMTTVHDYDGKKLSFTKGALDSILKTTTHIIDDGIVRPIEQKDIEAINNEALRLAGQALRVLALGMHQTQGEALEEDIIFLGIVGMIDPPRPEAKEAVEDCARAGITTVMITGDHRETAFAIAKEISIAKNPNEVISGEGIDHMTQEELNSAVKHLRVFARVSPENKVAIVRAFKANGNIVSMTGDGVNDAPSLKSADIGIAMGITGTDVAKGAADMILTDDNFATIKLAIEEGRNIYNNIRKAVLFLLSSNIGEVVTMFTAIALGWLSPLSPVHILWVNLVTDSLPGLALGVDIGSPEIMKKKPRDPKESLFAHGGYALLLLYGLIIGGVTLLGYKLGYREAGVREGQTVAVTVLAVSQLFHAIGMRDVNKSVFKMNHIGNKFMLFAFFMGLFLQVCIVQIPGLNNLFHTTQLNAIQWLWVMLLAISPLVAHEIFILLKPIINTFKRNK